jgi:hypothetical protein
MVGDAHRRGGGEALRNLVADGAQFDRCVVRDADAVINTRERVAVDEGLASARHFHVMRGGPRQAELALAGMRGGVRGALPPMRPAIMAFVSDASRLRGRIADQAFLRAMIWPIIRPSMLAHDSQLAFSDRRDFPRLGQLPPGRSIGDWVVPQSPANSAVDR